MSENLKTLIFAGVALAAALAGWLTRPAPVKLAPSELAGMTDLFPNLKDPRKVKALEIVEYDEQTAQPRVFEVKQVKGVWSIPSHRNYPADANRQMADAAAAVLDLKRLGQAVPGSSGRYTRDDHEKYGVIDPAGEDLEAGATGVGKRVVLKDAQGKELAKFIIGKSDPEKPDIRFLRIPGQDVVYKVEIDTHPLSTKFEDWIEKDLLKLNAFDIKRITVSDYSVDRLSGQVDLRSSFTVEYKDTKWSLKELLVHSDQPGPGAQQVDPNAPPSLDLVFRAISRPRSLAADEELDTAKLSDMRMALDDLKIVDVHRKPESLAEAIRAGKGMRVSRLGTEAQSLGARGFSLAPLTFGNLQWTELISSEGEVRVGMNDGVEYLLRFGAVAGREQQDEQDSAADSKKKKKKSASGADADDDESTSGGLTRFLMVVAQYNPDLIPPPELPALPEEDKPQDESGSDQDNADKNEADAQPDDQPDAGKESDADGKKPDADKKAKKKSEGKRKSKKESERERIQKERERLQKEYDDKVKKAQDRVAELNRRFADWYYVINENTYHKIHLTYQDIIKKKTQPAAGNGQDGAADQADEDKMPASEGDASQDGQDETPDGQDDQPGQPDDQPAQPDHQPGEANGEADQPDGAVDPDGPSAPADSEDADGSNEDEQDSAGEAPDDAGASP
jgi:hypothetical protein